MNAETVHDARCMAAEAMKSGNAASLGMMDADDVAQELLIAAWSASKKHNAQAKYAAAPRTWARIAMNNRRSSLFRDARSRRAVFALNMFNIPDWSDVGDDRVISGPPPAGAWVFLPARPEVVKPDNKRSRMQALKRQIAEYAADPRLSDPQ